MWPYYHQSNAAGSRNDSGSNSGILDKDDFLKILMVQLRHQDPLEPLQDREFIAQMAQFSTLEQITNVASELSLMRHAMGISSDLIGKEVEWHEYDSTGESIYRTGVVESIRFMSGEQYAEIEGNLISLDQITQIRLPANQEETNAEEELS